MYFFTWFLAELIYVGINQCAKCSLLEIQIMFTMLLHPTRIQNLLQQHMPVRIHVFTYTHTTFYHLTQARHFDLVTLNMLKKLQLNLLTVKMELVKTL